MPRERPPVVDVDYYLNLTMVYLALTAMWVAFAMRHNSETRRQLRRHGGQVSHLEEEHEKRMDGALEELHASQARVEELEGVLAEKERLLSHRPADD